MASYKVAVSKNGFRTIYDAASIFEAKLETVLMGKSGNWKPTKSEDRFDWHSKAIVSS